MAKTVDDILAAELGGIGGFFSGWVSRRIKNNVGEVSGELAAAASDIMRAASKYLRQNGRILEGSVEEVTGVVGGGHLNMNPVHVTIQVQPIEPDRTRLTVRAVAKEGMIKQYAGEETAPRAMQFIAEIARDNAAKRMADRARYR